MITVLFFAQVRELVGIDQLTLEAEGHATVEAIRSELSQKGSNWELALEPGKLLSAVNQTIVGPDFSVHDGDEVAFFPPVTGG